MKIGISICFLFLFSFSIARAHSNGKSYGVGVLLGAPIALTGRAWIGKNNAVDLGVAPTHNFGVLLDFLWDFHSPLGHKNQYLSRLILLLGGGAFLRPFSTLSLRGPLKLEYFFRSLPFGVGFEFAPAVRVVPSFHFFLQGGASLRFYF